MYTSCVLGLSLTQLNKICLLLVQKNKYIRIKHLWAIIGVYDVNNVLLNLLFIFVFSCHPVLGCNYFREWWMWGWGFDSKSNGESWKGRGHYCCGEHPFFCWYLWSLNLIQINIALLQFPTFTGWEYLDNELEVVEGMKLARGYISPYFVTDQKTQKCVSPDLYCAAIISPEYLYFK